MSFFILIEMILFHIIADFNLQGILADFKQKSWWKQKAPEKLYSHDWLISLIIHSFTWAVFMMLPIAIFKQGAPDVWFYILLAVNIVVHAIIDDFKANKLKISLVTDQICHLGQIILTFTILSTIYR